MSKEKSFTFSVTDTERVFLIDSLCTYRVVLGEQRNKYLLDNFKKLLSKERIAEQVKQIEDLLKLSLKITDILRGDNGSGTGVKDGVCIGNKGEK